MTNEALWIEVIRELERLSEMVWARARAAAGPDSAQAQELKLMRARKLHRHFDELLAAWMLAELPNGRHSFMTATVQEMAAWSNEQQGGRTNAPPGPHRLFPMAFAFPWPTREEYERTREQMRKGEMRPNDPNFYDALKWPEPPSLSDAEQQLALDALNGMMEPGGVFTAGVECGKLANALAERAGEDPRTAKGILDDATRALLAENYIKPYFAAAEAREAASLELLPDPPPFGLIPIREITREEFREQYPDALTPSASDAEALAAQLKAEAERALEREKEPEE